MSKGGREEEEVGEEKKKERSRGEREEMIHFT